MCITTAGSRGDGTHLPRSPLEPLGVSCGNTTALDWLCCFYGGSLPYAFAPVSLLPQCSVKSCTLQSAHGPLALLCSLLQVDHTSIHLYSWGIFLATSYVGGLQVTLIWNSDLQCLVLHINLEMELLGFIQFDTCFPSICENTKSTTNNRSTVWKSHSLCRVPSGLAFTIHLCLCIPFFLSRLELVIDCHGSYP